MAPRLGLMPTLLGCPALRQLLRSSLLCVACALFAHTFPAAAAVSSAPDLGAQFVQAVQQVEAARRGSASATPRAQEAFGKLLAADPENPLYGAYYGSTFALQAHYGHIPWERISEVHKSIAIINQSLSLLGPQHDHEENRGVAVSLETRLVAIATFDALPKQFGTMAVAKQQLALAMGSSLFDSASDELRGRYYYEAAFVAAADGDLQGERAALRRVLQYAPQSLDLNEVRAHLSQLGG